LLIGNLVLGCRLVARQRITGYPDFIEDKRFVILGVEVFENKNK